MDQKFLMRLKQGVGVKDFKSVLEEIAKNNGVTDFCVAFLSSFDSIFDHDACPYLEVCCSVAGYRAVFGTDELPPEDVKTVKDNASGKDEMQHVISHQPRLHDMFKDKIDVLYKKDCSRWIDKVLYW